jgi:hypothetical protein
VLSQGTRRSSAAGAGLPRYFDTSVVVGLYYLVPEASGGAAKLSTVPVAVQWG